MDNSIECVRNKTDRVELQFWVKNLFQCYILSNTYSRWNVLELQLVLRVRWSANNRLSNGSVCLDVKIHSLSYRVSPYRTVNSLHLGYNNELAIAV